MQDTGRKCQIRRRRRRKIEKGERREGRGKVISPTDSYYECHGIHSLGLSARLSPSLSFLRICCLLLDVAAPDSSVRANVNFGNSCLMDRAWAGKVRRPGRQHCEASAKTGGGGGPAATLSPARAAPRSAALRAPQLAQRSAHYNTSNRAAVVKASF